MLGTTESVTKYVNCGACHALTRSQDIGRRLSVGVRDVPLCAGCARRDDKWIRDAVEYGATVETNGDVTRKG